MPKHHQPSIYLETDKEEVLKNTQFSTRLKRLRGKTRLASIEPPINIEFVEHIDQKQHLKQERLSIKNDNLPKGILTVSELTISHPMLSGASSVNEFLHQNLMAKEVDIALLNYLKKVPWTEQAKALAKEARTRLENKSRLTK